MTERTYSVPGVSCEKCKSAIEGEVSGLVGVAQVEVDLATKTVRVVGDAPDDALRSAIDRAGYDVAV
jgi:copper chaperone CopZ